MHQQFERLDAPPVLRAHHDLGLADHQFVAFAAHRLDQNRELQFAAAEDAKRVGGAGVFHAQRNIGQQFALEPRSQVARGHELPFPPGEWRRIDRKDHRQRRLVDRQRFERRGIREIGDALADLNALDARDRHDVAREYLLGFVAIEPAEREQLRDLRRLNFSVELGDADFRSALQRSLKHARNRQAAEKIAVIEVRDLNLQHGFGIARRRRNRRDDLLEERLERRRAVVELAVRDTGLRIACKSPENRAGLRWRRDR